MDRRTFLYPACCAAAALAVLLTYSNHFHNSFHFDDAHAIEANLYLRDLRNLPRFFTDASTFSSLPANQSYRPLTTSTLAIDYRFGGLDPLPYHIDSFALFFIQCVLMLLLFRKILGNKWLALFGAALYGLHAGIAETVNYIIQRGDILSTLFSVLAVLLFALQGRARRYHLYLIPCALAVLSKEQGAMAAPLILLYAGLIESRQSLRELLNPSRFARALRGCWPAFIVCGALGVLAIKMPTTYTPGGQSRLQYLLTQPYVMLHYVVTFLLPTQLSADTDWETVRTLSDYRVPIGFIFVIAMIWIAFRASRSDRARPIAFGILWFFAALLPTSSVIPLAEVMNDHRLYFSFVGLALAAACAVGLFLEWSRRPALRPIGIAAAALVLLGHAAGAHARNRVWRSEETLWADVTEKSPRNGRGWMNWGLAKMSRGDWKDAEQGFRKALELAPLYSYAHENLAILLAATGRSAEAEPHFQRALQLTSDVPVLYYFYARWLDREGRSLEALSLLRRALALSPGEAGARQLLLSILAKQQDWRALSAAARDALAVRSDDPTALQMLKLAESHGNAPPPEAPGQAQSDALVNQSLRLWQAGRYAEMIPLCDAAIALKPDNAEAYNNKCSALNQLGRYREAIVACEAALRIRPSFDLARNNLALAKAKAK